MKRNRKGAKREAETLQVWTLAQAQKALPYVRSIMQSLREDWLEWQSQSQALERLQGRPGRPDRTALIAQEETRRQADAAGDRVQEGIDELRTLDIFCVDPVRGEAIIPFAQDKELAWYVFDLFEPGTLRTWRYHRDPLTMRRPLEEESASAAAAVE